MNYRTYIICILSSLTMCSQVSAADFGSWGSGSFSLAAATMKLLRNNRVENELPSDTTFPVQIVIENVRSTTPLSEIEKKQRTGFQDTGDYPSVSFVDERTIASSDELTVLLEQLRTSCDGKYFIVRIPRHTVLVSFDTRTGKEEGSPVGQPLS